MKESDKFKIDWSGLVIGLGILACAFVCNLFFRSLSFLSYFALYSIAAFLAGFFAELKARNGTLATSSSVGLIGTIILTVVFLFIGFSTDYYTVKVVGGIAFILFALSMVGGALAVRLGSRVSSRK